MAALEHNGTWDLVPLPLGEDGRRRLLYLGASTQSLEVESIMKCYWQQALRSEPILAFRKGGQRFCWEYVKHNSGGISFPPCAAPSDD